MAEHILDPTRRLFLQSGAALTLALTVRPRGLRAATGAAPAAFAPNALLTIEPDDTVRIVMPHADLGCGAYTGLAQVLADELDAAWGHVVAEHLRSLDDAFKHREWGVIATGASTSVSNQWTHFREVGATARAMLVAAAAARWNVPAARLVTADSVVRDPASGRSARYGELTADAAARTPPATVTLKSPDRFTLIGREMPRVDAGAKSDGSATFGIDVRLPGMLHAAIVHPPVFGAKLVKYDDGAARALPGVRAVVAIPTGVAVIADSYWQAQQARSALAIEWDEGDFARVSSDDLWREYAALGARAGPVFRAQGQLAFENATDIVEEELRFPFLAHAPMEPLNTTARVADGRCELWSGTQFQGVDAGKVAAALGIDVSAITLNTQWLGGSFGRRASPHADYLVEAAQIAQASGLTVPIKLTWQREDDIRGGLYRPMVLHRYRVGVDADGLPRHWQHRVVGASISTGTPFEAAFVVDGFDMLSIEGLIHSPYRCDNLEFTLHTTAHPVSVCWLRGEADTHTAPVVESLVNRLARRVGQDPFAYRRRLLDDSEKAQRMRAVMDLLERTSGWSEPPPPNVFRGLAVHASFGSVCGFVVELKRDDTRLSFHRVTAAMDCGRVINPAMVRTQVQGAAAFALSTLVGQEITIADGRAVQGNFNDYVIATQRQTPDVDVHLVASALDHPTGVGEVGVAPFIPAVMEAVFAATGQEVTRFPLALDGYTFLDG